MEVKSVLQYKGTVIVDQIHLILCYHMKHHIVIDRGAGEIVCLVASVHPSVRLSPLSLPVQGLCVCVCYHMKQSHCFN